MLGFIFFPPSCLDDYSLKIYTQSSTQLQHKKFTCQKACLQLFLPSYLQWTRWCICFKYKQNWNHFMQTSRNQNIKLHLLLLSWNSFILLMLLLHWMKSWMMNLNLIKMTWIMSLRWKLIMDRERMMKTNKFIRPWEELQLKRNRYGLGYEKYYDNLFHIPDYCKPITFVSCGFLDDDDRKV